MLQKIDRSIAPLVQDIENLSLIEPKIYKLDNGVPVFSFHSDIQPVMKIHVLLDAGKWYQSKSLIAYFTSKMLREGSKAKSAEEFSEALDFYGAGFKTTSGQDVAGMTISLMNKHAESILPLIKELITEPGFREDDFEVMLKNEKQAFLVDRNKNDFVADRHFNKLIFGENHPYGRVYELEDYDSISIEDIHEHYKKYYNWGNAKILVAGDLDEKRLALLNESFGQIQAKNSIETPNYILPDYEAKKERFSIKDAQQAALRVGMRSIDRNNPDYLKFSFVNTLFGAHFGSRLMTNIREDKGYTYGIYSYLSNYKNGNSWEISTEVGVDVADAALQEIYFEMERLSKEPVSAEEMLLVRNYLSGRLLSGLDGVFKQAVYYKALLIFGLNYGYIYDLIKTIQTVTAEDVMQIAQKYLQKELMTELVVE